MYHTTIKHARRAVFAVLLWCMHLIGCWLAPFISLLLLYPPCWRNAYLRNVAKASDRMNAAYLGKSGRMTLSTEMAFDSRFASLRAMVDYIEADHCMKSVWAEGPYCRLSDRAMREK